MSGDTATLAVVRQEVDRLREACSHRAERLEQLDGLVRRLSSIEQESRQFEAEVANIVRRRMTRRRWVWLGLIAAQSVGLLLVLGLGLRGRVAVEDSDGAASTDVGLEEGPDAGLPKLAPAVVDNAQRSVDEGSPVTAGGEGGPGGPSDDEHVTAVKAHQGQADIVIYTVPFEDSGTTQDSKERRIDRYDCAPEIDESGAEMWYPIDVPKAGVLVAKIPEVMTDGIDVDLHLLNDPSAAGCMVRGNAEIRTWVEARRYWLVVDTFVVDGLEKGGDYSIKVKME